MMIRAAKEDARTLAELAMQLWTTHSVGELTEDFAAVLRSIADPSLRSG